jgi:hypothetical protein
MNIGSAAYQFWTVALFFGVIICSVVATRSSVILAHAVIAYRVLHISFGTAIAIID